jgi:hypothetical protein
MHSKTNPFSIPFSFSRQSAEFFGWTTKNRQQKDLAQISGLVRTQTNHIRNSYDEDDEDDQKKIILF